VFEWRKREVVLGTQIEFHVLWSFSDGVVRRGFYLCLSFDFTSGGRELEGNIWRKKQGSFLLKKMQVIKSSLQAVISAPGWWPSASAHLVSLTCGGVLSIYRRTA
jgi:hypothetical protein